MNHTAGRISPPIFRVAPRPRKPTPDMLDQPGSGSAPPAPNSRSMAEPPNKSNPTSRTSQYESDLERGDQLFASYWNTVSHEDNPCFRRNAYGKVRLVKVPLWVLRHVRSLAAALVAAQLLYYLDRARKDRRPPKRPNASRGLPRPWIAVTAASLAKQTGLDQKQVEHSLKTLKGSGFISVKAKIFFGGGSLGGKRCSHVWLGPHGRLGLAEEKRKTIRRGEGALSNHVFLWSMRACGNDVRAAIVLSTVWSHFHRTFRKAKEAFMLPQYHCYGLSQSLSLSRSSIARWTGLSEAQVKRSLAVLRQKQLVHCRQARFGTANINSITVDCDQCSKFILLCAWEGRKEHDGKRRL